MTAFIKTRANHLERNKPSECDQMHEEQEYRYGEAFGPILRQSFLLSLATIFEHAVNEFLGIIHDWRSVPISPSDLKGDLLEKIKTYAFRLGQMPIGIGPELWQDMDSVVAIRNCLVHHAGKVSASHQRSQIYAFADRHGDLIIEHDHIQVTEELCRESHKVVLSFLDALYGGAFRTALSESER